jgi:hypothetical protein
MLFSVAITAGAVSAFKFYFHSLSSVLIGAVRINYHYVLVKPIKALPMPPHIPREFGR